MKCPARAFFANLRNKVPRAIANQQVCKVAKKPREKNSNERGQAIAIDLLFAIMIFLLLLNAGLSIWKSNASFLEGQGTFNELQLEAARTADQLVRTAGTPDNWEEKPIAEATAIGLAKRDLVLDDAKVNRFIQLAADFGSGDYNETRLRLLAGRDFYFKLGGDGAAIAETGKPPDLERLWAVDVKRIVKYGGEPAVAELTLYYPK